MRSELSFSETCWIGGPYADLGDGIRLYETGHLSVCCDTNQINIKAIEAAVIVQERYVASSSHLNWRLINDENNNGRGNL